MRLRHDGARSSGLDGLRGVFVSTVVIGHLFTVPFAMTPLGAGSTGVSAFFVLSGFVITLALEKSEIDSRRLRQFYIGRYFRILPAFAVYTVTAVIFLQIFHVGMTQCQIVTSALMLENYSPCDHPWMTGHLWSVNVEWQFYLIWPLILCFCRRRIVIRFLAASILLLPIVRVGQYMLFEPLRGYIGIEFHTRFDALSVGCLLALAINTQHVHRVLQLHSAALLKIGFCGLVTTAFLHRLIGGPYQLPLGFTIEALSAALVVASVYTTPPRFLARGPLLKLGVMSYSVYLWQQFTSELARNHGLPPMFALTLAFIIGYASRVLIEQPMIQLGRRLQSRKARSRNGESSPTQLDIRGVRNVTSIEKG